MWWTKWNCYGCFGSFPPVNYPLTPCIHSIWWPTWRTILFYICLFKFSTCFEHSSAHHQETQLYQYGIWYMSLYVGDRLVCRFGRNVQTCIPDILNKRYHCLFGSHIPALAWTVEQIDNTNAVALSRFEILPMQSCSEYLMWDLTGMDRKPSGLM